VDVARHRGASGGFLLDRHEASGAVAVTASRSTDTPTALGGAGKSAAARCAQEPYRDFGRCRCKFAG
jgi:hypothetical protein